MNPIEITKQEEGNYYLPCGSPFQNIRPMTPIDHVIQNLYHTMANLSDEIIYQIQQYTFLRLNNNSNQYPTYDADRVDDHHKDDFQSISAEEISKEQVKENINIEFKEVVKEEVKVQIKKEDDDDEEVSKVNSGSESGSESESEPDISESKTESKIESKIESKPKYEPKSEPNKSNQSSTKENTPKFIFGIITSFDNDVRTNVKILIDGKTEVSSFPPGFKYYGNKGDKVRVSINPENKFITFFNTIFKEADEVTGYSGDEVTGFVSITSIKNKDNNEVTKKFYVNNIPGIKQGSFPSGFNHPGLKNGDKVLCSIFKTYDHLDKETKKKIDGIGAILTFKSITK